MGKVFVKETLFFSHFALSALTYVVTLISSLQMEIVLLIANKQNQRKSKVILANFAGQNFFVGQNSQS